MVGVFAARPPRHDSEQGTAGPPAAALESVQSAAKHRTGQIHTKVWMSIFPCWEIIRSGLDGQSPGRAITVITCAGYGGA